MENKKYLVDSSVWVALFIDTDSQHSLAVNAMSIIGDDAVIFVPYIVMTEVVTVLTTKHSFEQWAAFIHFLEQDSRVFVMHNSPEEEMRFFLVQKQKLSFVDVILIGIALKHAYHLVTFDEKMQKYYSKILPK